MNELNISTASDIRCELGENPLWDDRRQSVFWTDIPAGELHQFHLESGLHRRLDIGEQVGGFTLQENGDLLLFRVSDIALVNPDSGEVVSVRKFQDEGMQRFNDVIADPEGRVFAGTVGTTAQTGGLYRVDLDGSITRLFAGTRLGNGMGFSPDLKMFYWTCSTSKRIFRFDYDRTSGAISNRQVFYEAKPDEGIPDGLTVDAEGCVWSARWGGFDIKQHGRDGAILSSITFPVPNISSVCFGGKQLNQLFVTSAQEPGEESEQAGALFTAASREQGKLEFRSRVRIS